MRILLLPLVLFLSGCLMHDRGMGAMRSELALGVRNKANIEDEVRDQDELWAENMLILILLGQPKDEPLPPRIVDDEF